MGSALRANRKYIARTEEAIRTRNLFIYDTDIREDMYRVTLRAMIASHMQAMKSMTKLQMSFESDWEALPGELRLSLLEYYGKLAAAAVNKAADAVREELTQEILKALREKPFSTRTFVIDALTRLGLITKEAHRVNTEIVTATASAYNHALWGHFNDPDLWGWEYTTAGDERVRSEHRVLDGMRYPKEHQVWYEYAPPNGWRCRCTLVPIYVGDPACVIRAPQEWPELDKRFKFGPAGIFAV